MFYLYIKTHNKTGLKYLGYTGKKDPHKYKGSGKRWKRHIKKHGYDVDTEIIGIYETEAEAKSQGLYLSEKYDIVSSLEWANLIPESCDHSAAGRANLGRKHSPEVNAKKAIWGPRPPEWKEAIRRGRLGQKEPIVTCPHCGTTGGNRTMKKWHFNNCIGKRNWKKR